MMKLVSVIILLFCLLTSTEAQYTTANAHSHNDYSNDIPFWIAYYNHFGSIEADIFAIEGDLFVAHDNSEIKPERTLDVLYIQPIVNMVRHNKGKAWNDHPSTFQLLIDLKTAVEPTLSVLIKKLSSYPDVFDPEINENAVRVVISGNRPDPSVFADYPGFISFDGLLNVNYDEQQMKRIPLFSENLKVFTSWNGEGDINSKEKMRLQNIIDSVHFSGKKIRFWNAPDGINAWKTFIKLGIDFINTDHINELTQYLSQISEPLNETVDSVQFKHNLRGDVFPWTKMPVFKNDSFRFVVIGDLTGGEEEGVFAEAIEKINQMAPDFVISVGDLIEGYTLEQQTIDRYWQSFQKRIARLDAPFFFVPGNHDLSNGLLSENWKNLYKYDYYSFTIDKSLFVVINTNEPGDGLSEDQLEYIKKVMLDHNPEDPVYVFSHEPLWKKFNTNGYNELEPILNKYNTTFFCGHEHRYLFKEVKGRNHIMLANTGRSSDLTNINTGEFNHFLFCTAGSKGIINIANILTDGIISTKAVDNSTEKQVNILRGGGWFSVKPVVINETTSASFNSFITISNQGDYPMNVTGDLPAYNNLIFSPAGISETIPSGSGIKIPVVLKNPDKIAIEKLPVIEIKLTAAFNQDGKEIKSGSSKRLFIDNIKWSLPAPAAESIFDCNKPSEVEESWCWSGPEDGSFEFTVTHDKKTIYLHIKTKDDVIISDPRKPEKVQDRLYVHFSPDTSFTNPAPAIIDLIAGNTSVIQNKNKIRDHKISAKCVAEGNSLVADISIPGSLHTVDAFRLNIGFADLDDISSTDPSVIWWKPKWGSRNDYSGSGIFIFKPE